jgi:hypothetical protein
MDINTSRETPGADVKGLPGTQNSFQSDTKQDVGYPPLPPQADLPGSIATGCFHQKTLGADSCLTFNLKFDAHEQTVSV